MEWCYTYVIVIAINNSESLVGYLLVPRNELTNLYAVARNSANLLGILAICSLNYWNSGIEVPLNICLIHEREYLFKVVFKHELLFWFSIDITLTKKISMSIWMNYFQVCVPVKARGSPETCAFLTRRKALYFYLLHLHADLGKPLCSDWNIHGFVIHEL